MRYIHSPCSFITTAYGLRFTGQAQNFGYALLPRWSCLASRSQSNAKIKSQQQDNNVRPLHKQQRASNKNEILPSIRIHSTPARPVSLAHLAGTKPVSNVSAWTSANILALEPTSIPSPAFRFCIKSTHTRSPTPPSLVLVTLPTESATLAPAISPPPPPPPTGRADSAVADADSVFGSLRCSRALTAAAQRSLSGRRSRASTPIWRANAAPWTCDGSDS